MAYMPPLWATYRSFNRGHGHKTCRRYVLRTGHLTGGTAMQAGAGDDMAEACRRYVRPRTGPLTGGTAIKPAAAMGHVQVL